MCISLFSTWTVPVWIFFIPAIRLSKVDLPALSGPNWTGGSRFGNSYTDVLMAWMTLPWRCRHCSLPQQSHHYCLWIECYRKSCWRILCRLLPYRYWRWMPIESSIGQKPGGGAIDGMLTSGSLLHALLDQVAHNLGLSYRLWARFGSGFTLVDQDLIWHSTSSFHVRFWTSTVLAWIVIG